MQPDWEIWLDHQLSPIIARWMAEETNMVVKSSYALQSQKSTDLEWYHQAKAYGKVILISKDSDLPELITRLGSPPKLIYIKFGNRRSSELFALLKPQLSKSIQILLSSSIQIVEIE